MSGGPLEATIEFVAPVARLGHGPEVGAETTDPAGRSIVVPLGDQCPFHPAVPDAVGRAHPILDQRGRSLPRSMGLERHLSGRQIGGKNEAVPSVGVTSTHPGVISQLNQEPRIAHHAAARHIPLVVKAGVLRRRERLEQALLLRGVLEAAAAHGGGQRHCSERREPKPHHQQQLGKNRAKAEEGAPRGPHLQRDRKPGEIERTVREVAPLVGTALRGRPVPQHANHGFGRGRQDIAKEGVGVRDDDDMGQRIGRLGGADGDQPERCARRIQWHQLPAGEKWIPGQGVERGGVGGVTRAGDVHAALALHHDTHHAGEERIPGHAIGRGGSAGPASLAHAGDEPLGALGDAERSVLDGALH